MWFGGSMLTSSTFFTSGASKAMLPKVLICLVSIWLLTRVWVPVQISSKIEVLIFILVLVDVYKTQKNFFLRFPILWVPLSFLIPIATYFSLTFYSENYSASLESVNFEVIPRLTFFIFVAWCLRYVAFPLRLVLGLFATSLLISVAISPDLQQEISAAIQGRRVDFGFRNAQWTSFYFGILFVGLLLAKQWVVKGYFSGFLWVIGLAFCCAVLVFTETRAVWFAVLCVLAVRIAVGLFDRRYSLTSRLLTSVSIVILLMSVIGLSHERISDRLASEFKTVHAISSGNQLPPSSLGLRLVMWEESIDWIVDKPLYGWGASGKRYILSQTEKIANTSIRHFHNQYIDFLISYGLLGLVFVVGVVAYPFIKFRGQPYEEKSFAAYGVLFLALAGVFESYLYFNEGVLISSLILAPLLSRSWGRGVTKSVVSGIGTNSKIGVTT